MSLSYSQANGWYVDLPVWSEVPGLWLSSNPAAVKAFMSKDGVLPGADPAQVMALAPMTLVNLPDDTPLDGGGQIDAKAMRRAWWGSRFANPTWTPPTIAEP